MTRAVKVIGAMDRNIGGIVDGLAGMRAVNRGGVDGQPFNGRRDCFAGEFDVGRMWGGLALFGRCRIRCLVPPPHRRGRESSTSPASAPNSATSASASSGPVSARPADPWLISAINCQSAQDGVVTAANAHRVAIFRTTGGGHRWTAVGTWPSTGVSKTKALEQLGAPLAISFSNARDGLAEWYQDAAAEKMWVAIGWTTKGGRVWTLVTKHLALSS